VEEIPREAIPAEAVPSAAIPKGWVPAPDRRTTLRQLSQLEGAAILAAETVPEVLRILEVQRGTLRLLEDALAGRVDELDILTQAKEAERQAEAALHEFMVHLRRGVGGAERVELNSALSAMIAALAEEAGDDVRLRVAPSAVPIHLDADATLLERALIHLVRNAREAAPAGSDVRISWGPVYASGIGGRGSAAETELVRIRVEDRGEGIAPEHLPWILEPYYSLHGAKAGGRGLGLAVVRAIVEGHGGWLALKSRPEEGTVVDLFLPLPPSPVTVATPGGVMPDAPTASTASAVPATVLILEDDPLLARLIEQILSRNGYRTEMAGAPAEAERRWKRLEGRLDLVIVECELAGGRSGLALLRRWRRDLPELRAVVLDRRTPPDAEEVAGTVEGIPVLRRPFDPPEVLRRVREELASRAGGASTEIVNAQRPDTTPTAHPESPGPTGRMLAH
jgi:CheY-like chemotaxis protein